MNRQLHYREPVDDVAAPAGPRRRFVTGAEAGAGFRIRIQTRRSPTSIAMPAAAPERDNLSHAAHVGAREEHEHHVRVRCCVSSGSIWQPVGKVILIELRVCAGYLERFELRHPPGF
jgi:hypothetical protein